MYLLTNFRAIVFLFMLTIEFTVEMVLTGSVQSSGRHTGGHNSLEDVHTSSTTEPTTITSLAVRNSEPYFDPTTSDNVTALVGKFAYLSCRVRNLGNKTVSWIRHRDIHILTVGAYTYTSDQRFQATYHADQQDWTLTVKWAQKRDAGVYECQISTQPVKSYFVTLNVVVPTASILGAPGLHVQYGSTLNLTCMITNSPEQPAYIFWYHHDDVISYDSARGGVTVITEKAENTYSYLLIQNANYGDSGKYSCSPSNADVASIIVHVVKGERSEAMQTGSAGLHNSNVYILTLIVLMFVSNNHRLDTR